MRIGSHEYANEDEDDDDDASTKSRHSGAETKTLGESKYPGFIISLSNHFKQRQGLWQKISMLVITIDKKCT